MHVTASREGIFSCKMNAVDEMPTRVVPRFVYNLINRPCSCSAVGTFFVCGGLYADNRGSDRIPGRIIPAVFE